MAMRVHRTRRGFGCSFNTTTTTTIIPQKDRQLDQAHLIQTNTVTGQLTSTNELFTIARTAGTWTQGIDCMLVPTRINDRVGGTSILVSFFFGGGGGGGGLLWRIGRVLPPTIQCAKYWAAAAGHTMRTNCK